MLHISKTSGCSASLSKEDAAVALVLTMDVVDEKIAQLMVSVQKRVKEAVQEMLEEQTATNQQLELEVACCRERQSALQAEQVELGKCVTALADRVLVIESRSGLTVVKAVSPVAGSPAAPSVVPATLPLALHLPPPVPTLCPLPAPAAVPGPPTPPSLAVRDVAGASAASGGVQEGPAPGLPPGLEPRAPPGLTRPGSGGQELAAPALPGAQENEAPGSPRVSTICLSELINGMSSPKPTKRLDDELPQGLRTPNPPLSPHTAPTPQRVGALTRTGTPMRSPPGTPTRVGLSTPHRTPRTGLGTLTPLKSPLVPASPFVICESGGCVFGFTLRLADGVELGLDVEHEAGTPGRIVGLRVVGVKNSGAIEAWNRQCMGGPAAGKAVMPGDCIVAVNQATEPMAMLEECRSKQMLRLTVMRGSDGADAILPPAIWPEDIRRCAREKASPAVPAPRTQPGPVASAFPLGFGAGLPPGLGANPHDFTAFLLSAAVPKP